MLNKHRLTSGRLTYKKKHENKIKMKNRNGGGIQKKKEEGLSHFVEKKAYISCANHLKESVKNGTI